MEYLLVLLIVLGLIAVIGHGLWLLAAAILRGIFGSASPPPRGSERCRRCDAVLDRWHTSCPHCGLRRGGTHAEEVDELDIVTRHLRRFCHEGVLDEPTWIRLQKYVEERRYPGRVLPEDEPLPVETVPVSQAPEPEPAAVAEAIPTAEPPLPPPPPPPPRRTWAQLLAGFMEERNILWGELVGGLLMVGCSIALVLYLWQTHRDFPYFPFLIFSGITAALFGAGLYALHRLKLDFTGRGLLVIATLLVPLNCLVLADLPRRLPTGPMQLGIEVLTLALFAGLVVLAGQALVPGGAAWLSLAVVGSSASQFVTVRLLEPTTGAGLLTLLGLLPVACQGIATAGLLTERRRGLPLEWRPALNILEFLGLGTFALAAALSFAIFQGMAGEGAPERGAVLIALAGVPLLVGGLFVQRGLTADKAVSALRTGATAVALAGMAIMLLALVLALAWLQRGSALTVAVLDFVVLTAVAFGWRLPVGHAAALPCLALGYWVAVDWAFEPFASEATYGSSLAILALALTAAAEALVRVGRRIDGLYYAAGGGVVGLLSLWLVLLSGSPTAGQVAVVYGVLASACLAANLRWRWVWLTYTGTALLTVALMVTMYLAAPAMTWHWHAVYALLAAATGCLFAARLMLGFPFQRAAGLIPAVWPAHRHQPGGSQETAGLAPSVGGADVGPSLDLGAGWIQRTYAGPLGRCALIGAGLALPLLLIDGDHLTVQALLLTWLAAIWLTAAWLNVRPALFGAGQAVLCLAVLYGIAAWLDWITPLAASDVIGRPEDLQAYACGLAGLGLVWMLVRIVGRSSGRVRQLLEPPWPAVDRVVLGGLVVGTFGFHALLLAPHVAAELPGTDLGFRHTLEGLDSFRALALIALLAGVLLAGLWERPRRDMILGLGVLTLTIPVLIAGRFVGSGDALPTLAWGLATVYLSGSAAIWVREPVALWLRRHWYGAGADSPRWSLPGFEPLRDLFIAGAAVPVLLLAAAGLGVALLGMPGWEGDAAHLGRTLWLIVRLGPAVLIGLGLVGFALRDRSAGYAFAAGLVFTLVAMSAFALDVLHLHSLGERDLVQLLQIGATGVAVWTLVWLRGRRWASESLLRGQMGLAWAAIAAVLVPAAGSLVRLFGLHMTAWTVEAGSAFGWLTLLLAGAALALWLWQRNAAMPWEEIAVIGLGAVVLAACTVERLTPDRGLRVLLIGWPLGALGLVAAAAWAGRRWPDLAATAEKLAPVLGLLMLGPVLRAGVAQHDHLWAAAGILLLSAAAGGLALVRESPLHVHVSGLLIGLGAVLIWLHFGPITGTGLAAVVALGLGLASILWTAIGLLPRGAAPSSGRFPPFQHTAAAVSLALIAGLACMGALDFLTYQPTFPIQGLIWAAWAAAAAAWALLLADRAAPWAPLGLYLAGLTAISLGLLAGQLSPDRFGWLAGLLLAVYALAVGAMDRFAPRPRPWPMTWFAPAQGLVIGAVLLLSFWVAFTFPSFGERQGGTLAAALTVPAAVWLATTDRRRYTTLALGVLVLAEGGWAFLEPTSRAVWLHRSVWLMTALAIATLGYGIGLARLRPLVGPWARCGRAAGPILGLVTVGVLLLVLGQEAARYDLATRRTMMAPAAAWVVGAALVVLIGAGICFAVLPGRDPFGLSEQGRMAYVYAAEVLAVLLFVHIRLNVPDLFRGYAARYWPFIVMGLAFLGVGLSEFFQRRGWRVLAEPLQRTGLFLPLLPLAAFWARLSSATIDGLSQQTPALAPFLGYLRAPRLPDGTELLRDYSSYAVQWFLLGGLLALLAAARRSFRFSLLAALAANCGWWALLYHHRAAGIGFLAHPQLWLIPLAVVLLAAEHVHRDQLPAGQAAALRYLALLLLYVSSTADMFLAGLGNSILLPIVLTVLAVLGVLAGILLRVRAFLFLGVGFLGVVVVSMIWHAAMDRHHYWLWWATGIVLGGAIIALFALFEKRRNEVLEVVEQLRQWD